MTRTDTTNPPTLVTITTIQQGVGCTPPELIRFRFLTSAPLDIASVRRTPPTEAGFKAATWLCPHPPLYSQPNLIDVHISGRGMPVVYRLIYHVSPCTGDLTSSCRVYVILYLFSSRTQLLYLNTDTHPDVIHFLRLRRVGDTESRSQTPDACGGFG